MLTVKTDSLGTASIRWQDVTRIRSESSFEIVLTDGSTRFGTLDADPAGNLLLPGTAAIPLLDVVALTPIRSQLASRFDGAVDLGYSFLKSSATTQFNFNGDVAYTSRRRSLSAEISNILVVRERTTSTRRTQADLDFNESLPRGYYALALGQFSRNDELNLIQRYLAGGALGRYLIRTNRSILSIYGGGAYSSERYAGAERRNNAEALVAVNTQTFRLISPKLDIGGSFRLWPNLTTSGRFRIDADFKARVEVYRNLFVSISIFDNYDRKSPSTASKRNDYGVITSIGYSFNR